MKAVSLRDLKCIPALSAYTELELIHPKMDAKIRPYVYEMGIDVEYPVEYAANNHRDLNDNTGIGYRILGDIRCDRTWLHSPWCDIIDRVAVTGYVDTSLTRELAEMLNHTVNFDAFTEENDTSYTDSDFTQDLMEKDFVEVSTVLTLMRKELLSLRGDFVTMLREDSVTK
jgi:hypothetical protein